MRPSPSRVAQEWVKKAEAYTDVMRDFGRWATWERSPRYMKDNSVISVRTKKLLLDGGKSVLYVISPAKDGHFELAALSPRFRGLVTINERGKFFPDAEPHPDLQSAMIAARRNAVDMASHYGFDDSDEIVEISGMEAPSTVQKIRNWLHLANTRTASANLIPVRQRTQYSCMSASMAMCLNALGHKCDEDEVNEVMGARPMKGAAWEHALACAQHYGCRATLTTPSTVPQLKTWTDAGVPVMIAWNPEGREWSHASVVFDVDDDGNVHVADPNCPDPEQTFRVVPKAEFYAKWYEKWPNYLVRRPACAIEREVTPEGRQVMANKAGQ